ncbi:MAG: hypothetical protein WAM30_05065 [Candidatus Dormiibacterota bacterium]
MTQPDAGSSPDAGRAQGLDRRARAERPDAETRRSLLAAAAKGDQAARESLLEVHLDLVLEAARARAQGGGEALTSADLFQEGTIGLLSAIDAYASSGEGEFEAYARGRIASGMDAAEAAETDAREESRELIQAAEQYERAEVALHKEQGRPPTGEELARLLGWTAARTAEVAEMIVNARRQHDEELLQYLDPEDVSQEELQRLLDERAESGSDGEQRGG